jgi:hemerythrin
MSFFEWKDEFSVKIPAIDGQHKRIIELMDELFEGIRENREDVIITEVLDDLSQYSERHFGLEAKLFRKFDYQKAKAHLAEHQLFLDRIAKLREEVKVNAQGASVATLDFLREWFQEHMVKIDSDYSSYFASKDLIQDIEASLH